MDLIQINQEIIANIKLLREARDVLKLRARDKSSAIGDYDKKLAKTLIQLKNGQAMIFEGEEIINPPATISREIAKGVCYKEKIAMELAEAMYKNVISGMDAIKVSINALQSILRYVDET